MDVIEIYNSNAPATCRIDFVDFETTRIYRHLTGHSLHESRPKLETVYKRRMVAKKKTAQKKQRQQAAAAAAASTGASSTASGSEDVSMDTAGVNGHEWVPTCLLLCPVLARSDCHALSTAKRATQNKALQQHLPKNL
jgi:hypothetical protein